MSTRRISVILGLALIALGGVLRMGKHDAVAVRVRYVPVTTKLVSGRIVVKPKEAVDYRIEVTPEMRDAQVVGSFTAYGGSTNTVSAVVMQESEYTSWVKGQAADAFYSSDGQKTADQFAVRLNPGVYRFGISNRASKSAPKFVFLDLDLIYYKAETY
jgi:hypothetical protein